MGAGVPITITVSALTEEANAKIQAFFAGLGAKVSGAPDLGDPAKKGGAELNELRKQAGAAKEGLHGLETLVLMLGGGIFPQFSQAIVAAKAALTTLRATSHLTGASLATVVPVLGGLTAALGVGAAAWIAFRDSMKLAEAQAVDSAKRIDEKMSFRQKLQALQTGGMISSGRREFFESVLQGGSGGIKGNISSRDLAFLQMLQKELAGTGQYLEQFSGKQAQPYLEEYLTRLGMLVPKQSQGGEKSYDLAPGAQAMLKLREVREELRRAQFTDEDDKKLVEISARYQKVTEAVKEYGRAAIEAGTSNEAALDRLLKQIGDAESLETAQVMNARAERRQQNESENIEREVEARASIIKEENDKLERELKLAAAQAGKSREQNYEFEVKKRLELLQWLFDNGIILEEEYTQQVLDQTIARLEGQRRAAEEARALQDARAEIELSRVQGQRRLMENDPFATELSKRDRMVELLKQENRLLQENIELNRRRTQDMALSPETRLQAARNLQELEQRKAENERAQETAAASGTWHGEFSRALVDLGNEWGSWASQAARSFVTVFNGAVSTISDGITGLIMGTKTWGQALTQIGTGILTQLVQQVTQMAVRFALMGALSAVPGAGALMGMGVAGFASGGLMPAGKLALVGERGPELLIPRAPTMALPNSVTEELLGGGAKGAGTAVHVWFNERSMMQMIKDNPEVQHQIVEAVRANRVKVGVAT